MRIPLEILIATYLKSPLLWQTPAARSERAHCYETPDMTVNSFLSSMSAGLPTSITAAFDSMRISVRMLLDASQIAHVGAAMVGHRLRHPKEFTAMPLLHWRLNALENRQAGGASYCSLGSYDVVSHLPFHWASTDTLEARAGQPSQLRHGVSGSRRRGAAGALELDCGSLIRACSQRPCHKVCRYLVTTSRTLCLCQPHSISTFNACSKWNSLSRLPDSTDIAESHMLSALKRLITNHDCQ